MIELKSYKLFHRASALTSPEFLSVVEFGNGDEVYDKDEADKVIADLEESHKMEVEQLLIEIKRLENLCASYRHDCDNLAIREANALKEIGRDNRVIRHQKYKRCLDKAELCRLEQERIELIENQDITDYDFNKLVKGFYKKWHKRWQEIAEKFKDNEAK